MEKISVILLGILALIDMPEVFIASLRGENVLGPIPATVEAVR